MATGLKFFRVSGFPTTGQVAGGIYFNKSNGEIAVWNGTTWEHFSGSVKDVTWVPTNNESATAGGTLTITKFDGSSIALDFSDVASASEVAEDIETALETAKTYANAIKVNGQTQTNQEITVGGANIALTGYEKPELVSAIKPTDTVNAAIGILEKKVDNAVAGGVTSVVAGNGIAVDDTDKNNPTISAKVKSGDSYIEVTSNGIASKGIDSAISSAIGALNVNDSAVAGKLVKAVSEEEGEISVTRDYLNANDIKLVKQGTPEAGMASTYYIVNGNNVQLGEKINIAKDQFLKDVKFYAKREDVPSGVIIPDDIEFPVIRFIFSTPSGDTETWISVKDLVDTYTSGNGIEISTNNVISVKVKSDDYIKVNSTNGVYTDGIDSAIEEAVDEEASRAKGVEGTLTSLTTDAKTSLVAAINEVDANTDANTSAITVINGTGEGSIKKAIADEVTRANNAYDAKGAATTAETNANGYTDSAITDLKTELTETVTQADTVNGLALEVVQTDGVLTSVSGSLTWNQW